MVCCKLYKNCIVNYTTDKYKHLKIKKDIYLDDNKNVQEQGIGMNTM